MKDYSELKLLAEAAAEDYSPPEAWDQDRGYCDEEVAMLDYIGKATPTVVLALIEENMALKSYLEAIPSPLRIKRTDPKYGESLIQWAEDQAVIRKDAERYQFLKNLPDDEYLIERLECATDPENWDAAIDAAMSKEPKA